MSIEITELGRKAQATNTNSAALPWEAGDGHGTWPQWLGLSCPHCHQQQTQRPAVSSHGPDARSQALRGRSCPVGCRGHKGW